VSFDEHPTVIAVRARERAARHAQPISSALIKQIAHDCGADDVGLVEIGRPALAPQLANIRKVYGGTRTLLSFIKRMNLEPVRSPTRSVANEEFHGTYDHVNETAREIVRALFEHGVSACNSVAAFPMEMDQTRIFMVQHKPIAVEAGLGKMGIHRSVIHPQFGSFVLLGTILLGVEVDAHDHPLDYNPCLSCKLCVAACPVSALKPDGTFDFQTCFTHNYHDFLGNFGQWAEAVADAKDAKDFRAKVPHTETQNVWQSLSFKPGYKAAYCISVCPAGEDVIGPFLEDRNSYYNEIVQPLIDKEETLFVIAGSDADESVPHRFPNKTIRHVRAGRHTDSIQGYLFSLRLGFQGGRAKGLDLTVNWTFTGRQALEATVRIKGRQLEVVPGRHADTADVHVIADTQSWFDVLNRNTELEDVLASGKVTLHGKRDGFDAYMRCFPF
jgi:ferredoxin